MFHNLSHSQCNKPSKSLLSKHCDLNTLMPFLSILCLLCSLWLCGCDQLKGTAARESEASQSNVVTEQEALAFAEQLRNAIETDDLNAFNDHIDWTRIVHQAIDIEGGDQPDAELRQEFIRQFQSRISRQGGLGAEISYALKQDGQYTLLRQDQVEHHRKLVFRLLLGDQSGFDYHEMLLTKNSSGDVKVTDLLIFSSGEYFSHTLRKQWLEFLNQKRSPALSTLGGWEEDYVTHLNQIHQLIDYFQEDEVLHVIDGYRKLPLRVQQESSMQLLRLKTLAKVDLFRTFHQEVKSGNSRAALDLYQSLPKSIAKSPDGVKQFAQYVAAWKLPDYDKAVEQFRTTRKHPATDFLVLAGYLQINNHTATFETIDRLNQSLGTDAWLLTLRAKLLNAQNEFAQARKYAHQAIRHDPNFEPGYWSLVRTSLKERNFETTIQWMTELQKRFDVSFRNIKVLPEFREFVNSSYFEKWVQIELNANANSTRPVSYQQ